MQPTQPRTLWQESRHNRRGAVRLKRLAFIGVVTAIFFLLVVTWPILVKYGWRKFHEQFQTGLHDLENEAQKVK